MVLDFSRDGHLEGGFERPVQANSPVDIVTNLAFRAYHTSTQGLRMTEARSRGQILRLGRGQDLLLELARIGMLTQGVVLIKSTRVFCSNGILHLAPHNRKYHLQLLSAGQMRFP